MDVKLEAIALPVSSVESAETSSAGSSIPSTAGRERRFRLAEIKEREERGFRR